MESLNAHFVSNHPQANLSEATNCLEPLQKQISDLLSTQVIEIAITKPMNNAIDHMNTLYTQSSDFIIQSNDRYKDLSYRMEMISHG